jgi:signal transduction histidine kinase
LPEAREPERLLPLLHAITVSLWLSVTVVVLVRQWHLAQPWQATEWLGLVALGGFLLAYLLAARATPRGAMGLVALQVTCVLLAFHVLPRHPIPALLTPVAAQLAQRWPGRSTWTLLLVMNALLALAMLLHVSAALAFGPLLLYMALQAFAALLMTALVRGEAARAEAVAAHGALQAVQSLLEETVRDRERLRMARDLHDLMGHKLTALQVNVQVLQRDAARAGHAPTELSRVATLATELLADTRALVRESHSGAGIALAEALGALGLAFPGSLLQVQVPEKLRLQDGALAHLLLRVAQEGVTNAIRHGEASRVVLELTQGAEGLRLTVQDNGRGLRGAAEGFGLTQLRLRVQQRGGSLQVRDLLGGGVSLCAELPEPAT